jgi:hypothetical protein
MISQDYRNGSGMVGVYYEHHMCVGGGWPPYLFTLISGALPDGLTLDTAFGVISGVPLTAGTFTYTITMTDSATPPDTITNTCTAVIAPRLVAFNIAC